MSDLYPNTTIPYGIPNADGVTTALAPGKWKVLTPAGADLCTIVLEGSLSITRKGIVIQRPGIFGQGSEIAVPADPVDTSWPAEEANTASANYQVPTSATTRPYAGCYISGTFDSGRGAERWVWMEETSAFPNNNYWTCSANLIRDHSI